MSCKMLTKLNKINPDLNKERQSSNFNVNEFANWFHDGAEKLELKRFIEKELFINLDDPLQYEYLSCEESYEMAVKKSIEAVKKFQNLCKRFNLGGPETISAMLHGPLGAVLVPLGSPFLVHTMMFSKALKEQSTSEQYERLRERVENFRLIGTYAQTELGHGTYLKGLETRADYNRKTDEFILNTPTLTSKKWWPGGLGHTANYSIVVAQLYIDNECKGIQLFLVQLRDEETHMPLPGIEIGDIGKKIGIIGLNNGYLGLTNVRIPRMNMLMRNSQVLPDGTFISNAIPQIIYFPMIYVRCHIASNCSDVLLQAATIATRYAAVRRQSVINPHEPEPQIIDHVVQQMKIFPEIAQGIANRLAANLLQKLYTDTSTSITNGDFSRLPELHALACTLKATCSFDGNYGAERLRLSCGGHGYLVAANFSNISIQVASACTYEGENSVLYLQVGKILLKTWADMLAGKSLMPTLAYLKECADWQQFSPWTGSWECMVQALQYTATNKTRIAFDSFKERLLQGQTQAEALNNTGIELTRAAELHGRAFIANTFLNEVVGNAKSNRSLQLNKVLENILELYLVHTIHRYMSDILQFLNLSANELHDIQRRLENALKVLRPNAVAICDGFDYNDHTLNSVLGSYDGNVYERIYDAAKRNPLNKKSVHKSFDLYLKPFFKSNM